uniref:X-box-binding protein 1 n=1 Tax=Schistocephalus solidus TaxID=70667 RepID=A0A0X3PMS2_SCHSO
MIPIQGVCLPVCQSNFSLPQQPTLAFVTASGDVYNSYTRRAITSERKRAKLDFLTEEEKAIRRKILNREAAQKARDRKKDSIKMMEQCIAQLRTENRLLRRTNVALREKCRDHEQKFISLRTELDVLTQSLKNGNRKEIEPSESAVLIPQQQGVALCLLVLLFLPLLCMASHFPLSPQTPRIPTSYSRNFQQLRCHPKLQFRPQKLLRLMPMR